MITLKRLTWLCLLLLLCTGWQCNTTVVEELTPPAEEEFDMWRIVLAEDGVVHSPIPDDVKALLWGVDEHTGLRSGMFANDGMTKYIDADGIAIIARDTVSDRALHLARGTVRAMMMKVPAVKEALSLTYRDRRPGIGPFSYRFRLALFDAEKDGPPQGFHGTTNPGGSSGQSGAWAMMWTREEALYMQDVSLVVHEVAHSMHAVIRGLSHMGLPNRFPDFQERLVAAYEREIARRDAGDTPLCYPGEGYVHGHLNSHEFWAEAVENYWFKPWWIAASDHPEPPDVVVEKWFDWPQLHVGCGDVLDLISEVFYTF